MFDIKTAEHIPENFFAGDFPIKKDVGLIKAGSAIRRHAPVIMDADGITEATAETIDKLCGISASEPNADELVYYLTGEFFADAVYLPSGITAGVLKSALRKLGIFLR